MGQGGEGFGRDGGLIAPTKPQYGKPAIGITDGRFFFLCPRKEKPANEPRAQISGPWGQEETIGNLAAVEAS